MILFDKHTDASVYSFSSLVSLVSLSSLVSLVSLASRSFNKYAISIFIFRFYFVARQDM